MTALLTIDGVAAHYGHIQALENVSLEVARGETVALIGANGAGKTTLLMTICGAPRPSAGTIRFEGRDITGWATHEIARAGIAHAPEGRRIFPRMTVMENLQMGTVSAAHRDSSSVLDRVFDLFPRLAARRSQRGGTLSGGEQQMLAIGRALMSRPSLLLLDEPSLGLAPMIVRQIFGAIETLNREEKVTVFLVEQNAYHALRLADRAYVMVNGRIEMTGTGDELLNNDEVRAAYLEGGARRADAAS
mgnify:FL=1